MKEYLQTRDFAVSKEEFSLLYDSELELLRTEPQPEQLDSYYQHESYISHTDQSKTLLEKIYQVVKKMGLSRKRKWLEQFVQKEAEILDIGAGTGAFVEYLNSKGWSAEGLEPNEKARNIAANKEVHLFKDINKVSNRKYDVITLWHVLEHFKDLDTSIDKVLGLLKDDGYLFIAVPNFKSYDARYYKTYWAAFDVPRHLWHFSRNSIDKLFNRRGWKVIEVKPMLFDSFYIALLSEKYKHGKTNWGSAFWRGLRSNWNGWKTGEYSALLYVLKKH